MNSTIHFISPIDFSIYKSLDITNHVQENYEICVMAYDLFVKNKIAVVLFNSNSAIIIDEDNNLIHDFNMKDASLYLAKMGTQWQLVYTRMVTINDEPNIEIYSLPGEGDMNTTVNTPSSSAPTRRPRPPRALSPLPAGALRRIPQTAYG